MALNLLTVIAAALTLVSGAMMVFIITSETFAVATLGPDSDCQVGALGVFTSSYTPDCAGDAVRGEAFESSPTLEFWPLFSLQNSFGGAFDSFGLTDELLGGGAPEGWPSEEFNCKETAEKVYPLAADFVDSAFGDVDTTLLSVIAGQTMCTAQQAEIPAVIQDLALLGQGSYTDKINNLADCTANPDDTSFGHSAAGIAQAIASLWWGGFQNPLLNPLGPFDLSVSTDLIAFNASKKFDAMGCSTDGSALTSSDVSNCIMLGLLKNFDNSSVADEQLCAAQNCTSFLMYQISGLVPNLSGTGFVTSFYPAKNFTELRDGIGETVATLTSVTVDGTIPAAALASSYPLALNTLTNLTINPNLANPLLSEEIKASLVVASAGTPFVAGLANACISVPAFTDTTPGNPLYADNFKSCGEKLPFNVGLLNDLGADAHPLACILEGSDETKPLNLECGTATTYDVFERFSREELEESGLVPEESIPLLEDLETFAALLNQCGAAFSSFNDPGSLPPSCNQTCVCVFQSGYPVDLLGKHRDSTEDQPITDAVLSATLNTAFGGGCPAGASGITEKDQCINVLKERVPPLVFDGVYGIGETIDPLYSIEGGIDSNGDGTISNDELFVQGVLDIGNPLTYATGIAAQGPGRSAANKKLVIDA